MDKNKWLKNSIVVCILASLCCGLWGSAFPFVKIGYTMFHISSGDIYSQILFAGTRFTLAGFMSVILGSCITRRILLPKVSSWGRIVSLGLFQTVVQYVLFYIGLSHTSGVKASIVEGTNVFVALFVASFVFHQEKFTKQKMLGCIIGFLGVIIVNLNGAGLSADIKFIGEGFIFLSTFAYAFSSVLLKEYAKKEDAIMLTGYQFIVGGLAMVAFGYLMGGRIEGFNFQSDGVLIYLAFISAAAYSLWANLLKYNPVSKVAVYGFMTPVFGVLLSAVLLGENQFIGIKCIIALVLVSAGIYIVNNNSKKQV